MTTISASGYRPADHIQAAHLLNEEAPNISTPGSTAVGVRPFAGRIVPEVAA